jgi:hypothetical protein
VVTQQRAFWLSTTPFEFDCLRNVMVRSSSPRKTTAPC